MSRSMLIVVVALAAYTILNVAGSTAVALMWRFRIASGHDAAPTIRARRLLWLRGMPTVAAIVLAVGVVTPSFAIFEPDHASEVAGPLILALAVVALALIAVSLGIAVVTSIRTKNAARAWLRAGVAINVNPPAGVPAYAINSLAPIVALVGVFRPKLVAARCVIDACTEAELAAIVAHERGHLHSRDNLKRWLMACLPDLLRWTPTHHAIARAWHDAAEDAADDAATPGDAASRVDLAALLIKIARLTPEPAWPAATISPFVEPAGLNRRVRRLLATEAATPSSRHRLATSVTVGAGFALLVALATRPAGLQRLYAVIEAVVAFGR
jgi:Zn-dependent protease with chaperone function